MTIRSIEFGRHAAVTPNWCMYYAALHDYCDRYACAYSWAQIFKKKLAKLAQDS